MIKIEIKATNPTLRKDKKNFVNYLIFDNVGETVKKSNPILKEGYFNVYLRIDNDPLHILFVGIDSQTLIKWVNDLEGVIPFVKLICENIEVDFKDFKGF